VIEFFAECKDGVRLAIGGVTVIDG
jgi:hypothetical protein